MGVCQTKQDGGQCVLDTTSINPRVLHIKRQKSNDCVELPFQQINVDRIFIHTIPRTYQKSSRATEIVSLSIK